MARRTFYKSRSRASQTIQLYLFITIFVFLSLLITTQCGLYRYKPNQTMPQLPSGIAIHQDMSKQIVMRLKEGPSKKISFEKLSGLIRSEMKDLLPIFSLRSTLSPHETERESCESIFLSTKRRSDSHLLITFPVGSKAKLSSLYTSLALAETIALNDLSYQISILIYDDALSCHDIEKALEDLKIPIQFSASIAFYPNPFQKDFLTISSGSHDFSSLIWQDIIPIRNDMNILKVVSTASSLFFDSPGHELMEAGIPSVAVGYEDKDIFSALPLKLVATSIEQFFSTKSDISNKGPWLTKSMALKSGFIWILVFLSLVIIKIETSEAMSGLNQKPKFVRGLISAFYFGIPIMTFFISVRLFSLNEDISQTMTFVSAAIAVLTHYLLNKVSISFLNVREDAASLMLICGLLISILIWNRPFFSFAVIPIYIVLIKTRELPSFLYKGSILMAFIPMIFFLVHPYGVIAMKDFLLDPNQINRYLAGNMFDIVSNSFVVGAFISLAIRN